MNIDWLAITPQSGKAGTNPISFQLISENDSFEDKAIRVRAVCGNARSEKTIVLIKGIVTEFAITKKRPKRPCLPGVLSVKSCILFFRVG